MKNVFITVFLTLYVNVLTAQINTDSIVQEICTTTKIVRLETDSLTIIKAFAKHLNQYAASLSTDSFTTLMSTCYYRLQKSCPEFKTIIDQKFSNNGDWKQVDFEPKL
jgi:hypothetical protein